MSEVVDMLRELVPINSVELLKIIPGSRFRAPGTTKREKHCEP
jgi:hypothetical protein